MDEKTIPQAFARPKPLVREDGGPKLRRRDRTKLPKMPPAERRLLMGRIRSLSEKGLSGKSIAEQVGLREDVVRELLALPAETP